MFTIEPIQARHEKRFIAAAQQSVRLHRPWISPPVTSGGFQQHLARYAADNQASYIAIEDASRAPIGCVHLNEIVRGALESSYMAYFVFEPFAQRGWMRAIMAEVIGYAFDRHGLHRLEANIQPANEPSRALVRRLGFRLEGFSPRYLKIGGVWRDHERYALTIEDWR